LGVSRTPVREALRQLELEGLVNIIPNKGAYVTGISEKDINDIYIIRSYLEGLCAKWACEHITQKQIEELEEYNCSSVDMSSIGNLSLPKEYYNEKTFTFTPAYNDFLSKIIGNPINPHFYYDFPKILPDDL